MHGTPHSLHVNQEEGMGGDSQHSKAWTKDILQGHTPSDLVDPYHSFHYFSKAYPVEGVKPSTHKPLGMFQIKTIIPHQSENAIILIIQMKRSIREMSHSPAFYSDKTEAVSTQVWTTHPTMLRSPDELGKEGPLGRTL